MMMPVDGASVMTGAPTLLLASWPICCSLRLSRRIALGDRHTRPRKLRLSVLVVHHLVLEVPGSSCCHTLRGPFALEGRKADVADDGVSLGSWVTTQKSSAIQSSRCEACARDPGAPAGNRPQDADRRAGSQCRGTAECSSARLAAAVSSGGGATASFCATLAFLLTEMVSVTAVQGRSGSGPAPPTRPSARLAK
jgi:hypothetical protein